MYSTAYYKIYSWFSAIFSELKLNESVEVKLGELLFWIYDRNDYVYCYAVA